MKLVILDGHTLNPGDLDYSVFENFGELTCYDITPRELTKERIGDAEIIFTNKTVLDSDILFSCKNLKYIGVFATGYNVIDLSAAKQRGITVCNVPSYSTEAVAQHATALLLECTNFTGQHSEEVAQGKWQTSVDFSYWSRPLTELAGKTAGIVGFGKIGRAFAKILMALSMNVLACSRSIPESMEGVEICSLDEIYVRADVISLHCPLTSENEKMINSESISKMKDGVIMLNTARGPLVDEAALAAALKSGKVSAAGLDVLEKEPPAKDCPIIGVPGAVITPHIGWAPLETRQRLLNTAVENLRCFLKGEPQNIVGS